MKRPVRRAPRRRSRHPFRAIFLVAVALLLSTVFILLYSRRTTQRPAKLAFFIQVSPATVLHLPRLLRALHHPDNLYAVHLDLKTPPATRARMLALLRDPAAPYRHNVHVLEPEPVSYAGVSMLLNTLNAAALLLRIAPWDFFINLSASDYPLVAPTLMRDVLGAARPRGLSFMQTQQADRDMHWFYERRLRSVHIDTALWHARGAHRAGSGELVALNATHPVSERDARLVKTEGWVILHRAFCEYAVGAAAARRLLVSFATARAADELFFGTLAGGEERWRRTVVWDGMRFVLWGLRGKRWGRPAFLDEVEEGMEEGEGGEVRRMLETSGALFARKFGGTESELLKYVDGNLKGIEEEIVDEEAVVAYGERVRRRMMCAMRTGRDGEGCARDGAGDIGEFR